MGKRRQVNLEATKLEFSCLSFQDANEYVLVDRFVIDRGHYVVSPARILRLIPMRKLNLLDLSLIINVVMS